MRYTRLVLTLVLTSILTSTLSGCVAAFVATAASSAIIANDRRTLGFFIEDENIELKANQLMNNNAEIDDSCHINAISYNGILLAVGQCPSLSSKRKAGELMRSVTNVKAFHNEIRITATNSLYSRSSDSYLTTKIKTKMTFEKKFDSSRIKVISENGEVFLMGLVTQAEADKAILITKNVDGVQKVINVFEYITL